MNTPVPLISIPAGWTLPARAADWQRNCFADRDWCKVFKALFRLKTGINLDDLEEILFPTTASPTFGLFLQFFSPTIQLTLFYALLALAVISLAIGGHLAFLGLRKYLKKGRVVNSISKATSGGKTFRRPSNRSAANYHRLLSVKVDKD